MRVIPLLLLTACAAPSGAPPSRSPDSMNTAAAAAARAAADEADFLQRLAEALAAPDGEDAASTMNTLEHLLPAWQTEQRRQHERPLEHILTIKVVVHFDDVLESFRSGSRARRLVAAWALGFSRVPANGLGIDSPHGQALSALSGALDSTDDDLLRNVLLGVWKLGDPSTPLPPLLDVMLQHHDPEVRANAALALGTVLTDDSVAPARDGLLVALADSEPKVRLHAASVMRRFPSAPGTERLLQLLPGERMPLVRSAMAAALGAARSEAAAPLLLPMLTSGREIESISARQALASIFGVDLGPDPAAWTGVIR